MDQDSEVSDETLGSSTSVKQVMASEEAIPFVRPAQATQSAEPNSQPSLHIDDASAVSHQPTSDVYQDN